MRILTQNNSAMRGFHGVIGDPTNMCDSFGNPLYIGDVVITSNQDEFAKQNKYLGNEYGIAFICEEKTDIVNWTGRDHQYVDGISSVWNDKLFADNHIDFSEDYWDELLKLTDGWIVHKVKDFNELAIDERIGYLHVQEVNCTTNS